MAAEGEEEPAPEPAPTPSWRPFVVSLAAPEGYSLDPLFAQAAEAERFEVVEVSAALATGDLAAEIKAWEGEHAGEELPGSLLAKALVAKVDEDRATGILKKQEPPPAPEEGAEEPAPAEAEEGAPPPLPTAPDPDSSADVYYVLKGFPRTAADAAAMAEVGLALDAMLALSLDQGSLKKSQGSAAAAEAAAPPPDKGGKGKKGKEEPPPPPPEAEGEAEAAEEGDDVMLPPPAICEEMKGAGSAVGDTAVLTCGMEDAEAWGVPQAVMGRVASLCFAAAQKKLMYESWKAPLRTLSVGAPEAEPETSHYYQLLAAAGPGVGVAYVLHAIVEQVPSPLAPRPSPLSSPLPPSPSLPSPSLP